MAGGRPTKLTPVVHQRIEVALILGMTQQEACHIAEIDESSFYLWVRKGEKQKSGIYAKFSQMVKRSGTIAQLNWLQAIERAIRGEKSERTIERYDKNGNLVERRTEPFYVIQPQWTAAAWKLERYNPQRWGRQVPLIQQNVQNNNTVLSLDEKRELLAQLQQSIDAEEQAPSRMLPALKPPKKEISDGKEG